MNITISPVFQEFQRQNHKIVSANIIKGNSAEGNKKLRNTLVALGIIAAAGIAIGTAVVKRKPIKLDKVAFEKGIATLKETGKEFTGTIVDKLKNGDEIILKYKDGIIEESKRTGLKNIEKFFENVNGDKIVHFVKDGVKSETNVTQKIVNALLKQEDAIRPKITRAQEIAQTVQEALFTKHHANKNAQESAKVFEEFFEKAPNEGLQNIKSKVVDLAKSIFKKNKK